MEVVGGILGASLGAASFVVKCIFAWVGEFHVEGRVVVVGVEGRGRRWGECGESVLASTRIRPTAFFTYALSASSLGRAWFIA